MLVEKKRTFFEHFEELRRRILFVGVTVVILSIVLYPFSDAVVRAVEERLLGAYQGNVITLSPFEAVAVQIKVSILMAVAVASPLIVHQTGSFLFPALKRREKRAFLLVVGASTLLFAAGCLFAYYVLMPVSYKVLLALTEPIAKPLIDLQTLIDISLTLTVLTGASFQWPLIVAALARFGIVSARALAEKRRYAILAIFALAAVVTADTTVVSQIILGVPMLILYEAGIIAAKITGKKHSSG
jgi:sec-independent protein translocase protein TatC